MCESNGNLPVPKKPVKYTHASQRVMTVCERAFENGTFALLYFTNRKIYIPMFSDPKFRQFIKNKFKFMQLSRADKSGNWLTSTYHFDSSPYYAIIDPSNGEFVTVHYGEMNLDDLISWLSKFNRKFRNPTSVFTGLSDKVSEQKRKAAFTYGTKLRIAFVCSRFDDRVMYISKTAPLEMAFEKYCEEQNIDMNEYYFMYYGVQLPPNMTASQFQLKNGSMIHVHHIEDRTSKEQISITVIGTDNNSTVYQVEKGRKIGQFLRNYCDTNKLQMKDLRFTYKNDVVNDDLTFAEHSMKDGDQILVHVKTYDPPTEYYSRLSMMMKPNEVHHMMPNEVYDQFQMPQINPMQQMAISQPPMMYMYNQAQRPQLPPQMPTQMQQIQQIPGQLHAMPPINPQIAPQIPGQMPPPMPPMPPSQQITGQLPFNQTVQYPMGPKMGYQFGKPTDQQPNQSLWENFEMP